MQNRMRWTARVLAAFAIFFIAGCAQLTGARGTFYPKTSHWQGRLALTVHSTPIQTLSADFELDGDPQLGSLRLSSALGSTLAQLNWSPESAQLVAQGNTQQFSSLDALVLQATGTPLPIAQLFDWVQGKNSAADGWEADLSAYPNSRIHARRTVATTAELKIILDQP